jgi:hypothetical protein
MTLPRERAAERVQVDAFVTVHGAEQELVFRTRDLSEAGLFLYTQVARSYAIKVGTTLTLELNDADVVITCTVVVVRIVEPGTPEADEFPTGFGVKITELTADHREALRALIARVAPVTSAEVG